MKLFRVLAALIFLFLTANFLLSFYSWFPSGIVVRSLVPIPEALLLLWVLLVIAVFVPGPGTNPGTRGRKILALVGAGTIVGVMIGFSLAEALFQWIYARSFVPRMDIPAIRSLLLLYLGDIGSLVGLLTPPAIAVLFLLFIGLGIGLVWASVRLLTRSVDGDPRKRRGAIVSLAVMTVVSVPFFFLAPPPKSLAAHTLVSWTESGRGEFYDIEVAEAPGDAQSEARTADEAELPAYQFPGILDRDIYLFTIEAYGYAAHSRPELAGQLEPSFRRLEGVLEEKGYTVLTSYLRSPVAGGFSWLAEATFFTGQWIDSQARFEQLYGADLPTLPGMLQRGGYYTMSVRPGTVHGAWPEGWDIYRLEESLTAYDGAFDFVGPWFSYVPVTDQFAIWTAHRRITEVSGPGEAAEGRPLFVHFQLVSSHTPFNRIPPYIEDWTDLGDGSIYVERSDEIRTYDNSWTGGTELEEGYVDAQSYVFRVITDYIDRHMALEDNPIIVIFGDHQAQRPIREREATLSVPIHVATRDPKIAEAFRREGYQPGMTSDQPPPHPEMSVFFPFFARVAVDDF
ncbi:MAG: hypothetical protein ACLFPV_15700 [Spirochaetaceae bacterium]